MSDITRQQNFTNGDLVTAEKLKNLIDNSSINTTFLTGKTELSSTDLSPNDQFLIYDSSALIFKKVSVLSTQDGTVSLTGRDYKLYTGITGSELYNHNIWAKAKVLSTGDEFYTGIAISSGAEEPSPYVFNDPLNGVQRNIGNGVIQFFSGSLYARTGQIDFQASSLHNVGGSALIQLISYEEESNLVNGITYYAHGNEFYLQKAYTGYAGGYQDSGQDTKYVRFIETSQVQNDEFQDTDDVLVTLRNKLQVEKINATEINATTYKKDGISTIFPIKKGSSEYTSGSEVAAYIGVPDTVFNTGFTVGTGFKVGAVASGGSMLWESTNEFSLLSSEVYFLTLDIWHNDISTSQGAYMDYRLRLKAKTVGGATYPMKEIAVRRHQVASAQGNMNHRLVFRIERSDFPAGGEDVTRQFQLQLTESNASISYKHYIVRADAEVWDKADITAGTLALL